MGFSNVIVKCLSGYIFKRGFGVFRLDYERLVCKVDGVFFEVIFVMCSVG